MTHPDSQLTPPQLLALRHAHRDWREELRILLLLDTRLCAIVQRGSEPLLTRMKLAWWRDALEKDVSVRPKGEPLLAAISALEQDGCRTIIASAGLLVDAWEEVADVGTVNEHCVARHHLQRAEAVFASFADRLGHRDSLLSAGHIWAGGQLTEKPMRLPRSARAFSLLARASLVERRPGLKSTTGFFWHALTGL